MFDRETLDEAAALVHRHMAPTPQYAWPLLAEVAGCEVWVKHENHTPTGAFKVRGGLTYLDALIRDGGCAGIATATRGNHGQSIPFAARQHGMPVRVWVPEGNSVEKNAAMQAWGAELVVHGHDFEAARHNCIRVAEEEGLHLIPPFHEHLVRGVSTYALELFSAVPDLDTVYVPIGMGSGICSLITVRDLLGLKAEIVGVVADGADAYALSFEAGHVVETNRAHTFADGMACRVPMAEPFEIIRRGAERILRVSDDETAAAVRLLYRTTHNVAEGAGAAPLAGLMQERAAMTNKRVAVILCGGNIDTAWFAQILAGETPTP